MIAALTWIKLIGISALILAVVGLWLRLDVAQTKNRNLVSKLEIAADTNRIDRAMIAELKNDNSNINSLLVKRQQESIQQKEKLNADIKTLKSELKTIDCYRVPWPDSVSDRLRESY